jgi:UDP-N-acetyl-2-amino-2-deoxyglucuronate dehydrogenase
MHMRQPLPVRERKIRFALVGCGRISQNHIERSARHADAPSWSPSATPTRSARAGGARTGAAGFARSTDCSRRAMPTSSCWRRRAGCIRSRRSRCAQRRPPRAEREADGDPFEDGHAMVRACRDAGVKLFVVKQNR